MRRKQAHWRTAPILLTVAACLMAADNREAATQPENPRTPAPAHAFALSLNQPLTMDVKSPGVQWRGHAYQLVQLGRAQFHLDEQARLTATLTGSVNTFDDVTYDVHGAVFNAQGQLLGTARTICPVARIWEGRTFMMARTLDFDFGINRDYSQARFFTVAISNTKVLTPDEWRK